MNVSNLGQVFTPQEIVERMLKLRKNRGRILEPSCGNGAFSKHLLKEDFVAIEIDKTKCPDYALNIDFFDYDEFEKFDTIIGNPPYVRYKDIIEETKDKFTKEEKDMFDERSNLYLFFIYKCIKQLNNGGELIFIVPKDFLKATSAIKLNNYIYETGTMTDIIDIGSSAKFKGENPDCIIFRYEKGNFNRVVNGDSKFRVINGQIMYLKGDYTVNFNELFFVKVGATSGGNEYFESDNGNADFVCSYTAKTGQTKRMFYNIEVPELLPYKDELLKRKIKKFTEKDWFKWGRNHYESDEERIYVNWKTRDKYPFFYHESNYYDGSILAIFPKFKVSKTELQWIIKELNSVDWEELGFKSGGRYTFVQKALENTLLPEEFEKYKKRLG